MDTGAPSSRLAECLKVATSQLESCLNIFRMTPGLTKASRTGDPRLASDLESLRSSLERAGAFLDALNRRFSRAEQDALGEGAASSFTDDEIPPVASSLARLFHQLKGLLAVVRYEASDRHRDQPRGLTEVRTERARAGVK